MTTPKRTVRHRLSFYRGGLWARPTKKNRYLRVRCSKETRRLRPVHVTHGHYHKGK